jgi:hypothetical protein
MKIYHKLATFLAARIMKEITPCLPFMEDKGFGTEQDLVNYKVSWITRKFLMSAIITPKDFELWYRVDTDYGSFATYVDPKDIPQTDKDRAYLCWRPHAK